ncbi:MAG TPA: NAD(P)H-dependent oxidoreductase [Streptosporangiaceae bacterium]|nr:NAD(P)H-dependent oxidoreductase [Streptosporangiaceae bacterium]
MSDPTVLAISGSLRVDSYNTRLLRTAQSLNPGGMSIELYDRMGELPLYNQDLDTDKPPSLVADLRRRIARSDGVLIATPEHNASIPAALKNAVDWASRRIQDSRLTDKPIAIIGASPGPFGTIRAQAALRQMFASIGAHVILKPEVAVPNSHQNFHNETLTDEYGRALLKELLANLATTIHRQSRTGG